MGVLLKYRIPTPSSCFRFMFILRTWFSWLYLHGPIILNNFLAKSVSFSFLFLGILVPSFFPFPQLKNNGLNFNISIQIHANRKGQTCQDAGRAYREVSRSKGEAKPGCRVYLARQGPRTCIQSKRNTLIVIYQPIWIYVRNLAYYWGTFFIQSPS